MRVQRQSQDAVLTKFENSNEAEAAFQWAEDTRPGSVGTNSAEAQASRPEGGVGDIRMGFYKGTGRTSLSRRSSARRFAVR